MASVIRTNTFLKYARIQLQEAEAALQDERPGDALDRCADVAVALTKALAASLQTDAGEFLVMDSGRLSRAIADLTVTAGEARDVAASLFEIRGFSAGVEVPSRSEAEAAFTRAGEAFRAVHTVCTGSGYHGDPPGVTFP